MKIIDTHCDALYKLQNAKWNGEHLEFKTAETLDTNLTRLEAGNVQVQFFAIFLEPDIASERLWYAALEQIELFHTEIIQKNPQMKHIRTWNELHDLQQGEIGAVLTLEGAECLGTDLDKLQYLYEQGIMSIGLTWNHANLCADGALEPRGGGLTVFGKEVVKMNNKFGVFTDVSHLCEQSFWDVMELADYPFASHSNARAVCDHPRNLNDEQIKAMIERKAPMHMVFAPYFVKEDGKQVTIYDLIKHMQHIVELGGKDIIGLGSDFDGIDEKIIDLEHAGQYQDFLVVLEQHFTKEDVKKFTYENFMSHIPNTTSKK